MRLSRRWALLPLLIFIVLAALLGIGLRFGQQERPSARLEKPFPRFALPTLADEHHKITLAEVKGTGPLVVNVWGSWCPSCESEMPTLLQLRREGVQIIGVDYRDEPADAKAFLARYGDPYAFNIVDASGTLSFDLGVYGAPESFIIDSEGVIRYHHTGVLTTPIIEQQIRPLIEELRRER